LRDAALLAAGKRLPSGTGRARTTLIFGMGGVLQPAIHTFKRMKYIWQFVNLKFEEWANRYPFELSGGQIQRT
jgi:ABC-type proline/glycine betaine transport system ATPase subunit